MVGSSGFPDEWVDFGGRGLVGESIIAVKGQEPAMEKSCLVERVQYLG